jgi:OmpA-OmpF porin, OOP family
MKFSLLAIFLAQMAISPCFAAIPDSTILKGKVLDTKTQMPVESELDIYYNSDFILDDVQLSHHGEYVEKLKHYGLYIITITAPGYLDVTDTLWVIDQTKKEIIKDFHLTPIEVGLTVVLNNIYFHFGTTTLKPESAGSLDKVVAFFKANPNIRFEIAGHTDDEGADDYNLALSLGRAQAVVDYLVKAGIESTRLTAEGYGENKPIDKGITKAAKSKNRRVEFIVRDIEKPTE